MKNIIAHWTVCSSGKPMTVWPDGCRDLIVCIEPKRHPKLFLTGLDRTAYGVNTPADTQFFGIRLAPGCVATWEKGRPSACEDIFMLKNHQSFSAALARKVLHSPEQAATLLLEAAYAWFKPLHSATKDFFAAVNESDGQIPMLTGSARSLRRHIRTVTGAPPQFWMSLQRVRRCAHDIVTSNAPLAEIALTAGYADQAHLTRDLRRWLGLTPATLRREAVAYQHLVNMPDAFSAIR